MLPEDGPLTTADRIEGPDTLVPRITAAEYYDLMDRVGLGGQNSWELIDGFIRRIDKSGPGQPRTTMDPLHHYAIDGLADLKPRFKPHGCYLRIEADVAIDDRTAPIPDGAIAVGDRSRYTTRHPTSADLLCVIEASYSSEPFDLNDKLRRYAAAGIPMYVVLRLRGRSAVVLSDPSGDGYATRRELAAGDTLSLPTAAGAGVDVPLADLLPPETAQE